MATKSSRRTDRRRRRGTSSRPGPGQGPVDRARLTLRVRAERAYSGGNLDLAERLYRELVDADQTDERAIVGLGSSLARRELLDHREKLPDALARVRGLLALGNLEESGQVTSVLTVAGPEHCAAPVLLARLHRARGRTDAAVAACRQALSRCPACWSARYELGCALHAADRLVEAGRELQKAVVTRPERAEGHNMLGLVYSDLGLHDDAVAAFRRVLDLRRGTPAAHANLGTSLMKMGRFADAAAELERAEHLNPRPVYRWNLSHALLGAGRLEAGWRAYESGRHPEVDQLRRNDTVRGRVWDGQPTNETVLIWCEQGVGDHLRLLSCLPDVLDRTPHVIVECDRRMVTLVARSFPQVTVRALPQTGERRPDDFSLHRSIGALPALVRSSREQFVGKPDPVAYLQPRQGTREHWRTRLAPPGRPRIGLAWRSGNLTSARLTNYMTLQELAPVLRIPGTSFFSLQYGNEVQVRQELETAQAETGVTVQRFDDLDYTDDFEGQAALIAELDLVVGVNTAPLMLAGALGVPTFMFGLADPMVLGGEPSRYPWFPRHRRFQRAWDDSWDAAVGEVERALREWVTARRDARLQPA